MKEKKHKYKIEVDISNIQVANGFYGFDWKVFGLENVEEGTYEGDFENGMSDKEWEKHLEKGGALRLVFEQLN